MRPRKTWEAVLGGRRVIPFEDFAHLLLAFGFVQKRTRGSHHIFFHPTAMRPLAQFLVMVEEFGLTMETEE